MANTPTIAAGITERDGKYYRSDGRETNAGGWLMEPTDEESEQERQRFHELYPDAPEIKPVECLDLITTREEAEQILMRQQTTILREFCDYYFNRLVDTEASDYALEHEDDPVFYGAWIRLYDPTRPVDKIHFHNFNNTWFLDVSLSDNGHVSVSEENANFMLREYCSYTLYEKVTWLRAHPEAEVQPFFYFVIDDILATNLD